MLGVCAGSQTLSMTSGEPGTVIKKGSPARYVGRLRPLSNWDAVVSEFVQIGA